MERALGLGGPISCPCLPFRDGWPCPEPILQGLFRRGLLVLFHVGAGWPSLPRRLSAHQSPLLKSPRGRRQGQGSSASVLILSLNHPPCGLDCGPLTTDRGPRPGLGQTKGTSALMSEDVAHGRRNVGKGTKKWGGPRGLALRAFCRLGALPPRTHRGNENLQRDQHPPRAKRSKMGRPLGTCHTWADPGPERTGRRHL